MKDGLKIGVDSTPFGVGAFYALRRLWWPGYRGTRNVAAKQGRREAIRLLFFAALGTLFMMGAFWGAHWLFQRFLEVEFLAQLLTRRVLDITLLFFTGLLLFSNLISGFSTLYLSQDLQLLVSTPIPLSRLYLARLGHTWMQASWMMLVFALPILAGCGPSLGAKWWFYPLLPLVVLPLTVLCSSFGTWGTMLIARWLPAQRMRDLMVLLALLGFLVLYVAFRFAEPERFLEPDGFQDLVSLIGGLEQSNRVWMPTTWVLDGLFALVSGDFAAAILPVSTTYLGAGASCWVGTILARRLFLRSFSLAQEGRREDMGVAGALLKSKNPENTRYPASVVSALVYRDNRVFLRTTSQWTQLLLVAALVVVYLFNFKHFKTLQDTNIISELGILILNLALCGMVVTTLAARFLYPSVSLEGRAFWAIQVAPMSNRSLLEAKVRWGFIPLLSVNLILTLGSNWITGLPTWMFLVSTVFAIMSTWGIVGMGIGMGAMDPKFHLDNPTQISGTIGGVLFMLLALALLVVLLLLVGWPMSALRNYIASGYIPRPIRLGQMFTLLIAAMGLAAFVHAFAIRAGANGLDRREP